MKNNIRRTILVLCVVSLFVWATPAQASGLPSFLQSGAQFITRTLKLGTSGSDVKTLQQYLAAQADIYPSDKITGFFGSVTKEAVSKLQGLLGLNQVGEVGPQTRDAINQDLAAAQAENNVQDYTTKLLDAAGDVARATPDKKQVATAALVQVATARKQAILEAMSTNPDAVVTNTLSAQTIGKMPESVQAMVEQKKQIKGTFQYLHIHWGTFNTGTPEDQFYLIESKTGKKFRVFMSGDPSIGTGDTVNVTGSVLENQIATTTKSIQLLSSGQQTTSTTGTKTTGGNTKHAVVVLFNFQNDTSTPVTTDQARGMYFTNPDSVANYYKEASFGTTTISGKSSSGDVYGWYTIPYDNSGCNFQTWSDAAKAQAQAAGVNFTGYDLISYVFPGNGCGFAGAAYIGGTPGLSWITYPANWTAAHEIGHNLGEHHASTLNCIENGVRVSISAASNCTSNEYGDMFDIMGNSGYMHHLNDYHKGITGYSINWLSSSNTYTINPSTAPDATYTIAPLEVASNGIMSLRIPRTSTDYYYLEFRQPYGLDSFAATDPAVNGVMIRIAPDYNTTIQSKLIDATPETSTFSDAALPVGRTFTDPVHGINVTVLSVSSAGAQVRVNFTPVPCIQANPTVSLIYTNNFNAFPGKAVTYQYTITNNDTPACNASDFSVAPTLPAGFTQDPSPIVQTIAAGARVTGNIYITTPIDAVPGLYTVPEVATNIGNPSFNTTATANVNVLAADTTAPTVTITKPANGSVIKGKFTITASATDNYMVAKTALLVNGTVVQTCTSSSCTMSSQANSFATGSNIISAQATDAAGNIGTASITVTK